MIILGISAYYHDSAAALIIDGKIIAAAQEERFTRIKHDPSFPINAVKYCLEEAGVFIDDVAIVAFYDKPFLKFERLLETYYGFAPKGLLSFIRSVPVWVKEKLFLKSNINKQLKSLAKNKNDYKLLFPEHHLSHAASAFYPSPYQDAAILTLDGVGEWATASICHGQGENITILKELRFPHSLGLLYSSFTYFLGFKVNSGEYKMMGLAPYGDKTSTQYKEFKEKIYQELVELKEDGSIRLNQKYFNYATGLRMVNDQKWEALFGLKKRNAEDPITQEAMNLALAIQSVTEDVVVAMAREAKKLTGSNNLCLAGGVALNCVSNGKLYDTGLFDNIWIQPAAGDAGGALGCALAAYHIHQGIERNANGKDQMHGSYLGPAYYDSDVIKMAKKYKAVYEVFSPQDIVEETAKLIADEHVIGWFQGRMEFGPRALGHRSILGDARSTEMQTKLNLKIKYRESFRPFAPSVLRDDVSKYLDFHHDSPYMLIVREVSEAIALEAPKNYHSLQLMDKLKVNRSSIPAVTHVDYSARIQTVDGVHNKRFHQLIQAFKNITGEGILINTSFNVRGEPIVCTPEDAYRCFMRTEMDYLVINEFIFNKKEQPEWKDKEAWQTTFPLD